MDSKETDKGVEPREGAPSTGASAVAGVLMLLTAGAGGYVLAVATDDDRYPVRVEYQIAHACIDGAERRLPREDYVAKREVCLCALEKTMPQVSYREVEKANPKFAEVFRKETNACAKGGRR